MPLTVRTIWKTQKDPHVCPICKALEGYTWVSDAGDPYPKQLIHPFYGPVYDTRPAAEGSLIKEEKGHICRCTLQHEFDVSNPVPNDDGVPLNLSAKPADKKLVHE